MGNPTSYANGSGRWTFQWDGRELTSAVIQGSGNPITYSYDENGLRTTKTVVNGTSTTEHTYLYAADGKLLREIRDYADGTQDILEFYYSHDGRPYAFFMNGQIFFYILNLQGDVVRIVDSWGRTQATYTYNAWGKVLSAQTTDLSYSARVVAKNPILYRGYYYDAESKLYYLQSRYYDPSQGRFINGDACASTGQGILGNNMYAYCLNNPVNFFDNDGEDAIWIQEKGSAKGFGHSGLLVEDEEGDWWYFYWGPEDESADIITLCYTPGHFVLIQVDVSDQDLRSVEGVKNVISNTDDTKDADRKFVKDRTELITDIYYLEGDYSETFNYLKSEQDDGDWYSLLFYNCVQRTWKALSKANKFFKKNPCDVIPNFTFTYLKLYESIN